MTLFLTGLASWLIWENVKMLIEIHTGSCTDCCPRNTAGRNDERGARFL